jgi:predicted amidohydrolase
LRQLLSYLALWLVICLSMSGNQALAVDKIPLKVATVCMNAAEDTHANLETFFSYMEEAAAQGAHLIVFPEIALQQNPGWGRSSYTPTQEELDYVRDTAEAIPGDSTQKMVEKASELNIYVVFGMTEKVPGDDNLYNASVFLGPDGIIGKYRKINVAGPSVGFNEHFCWKRGAEVGVFDSPIGKFGLLICADMLYNLGVSVAQKGAEILVTASAWPSYAGGLYDQHTKQNASLAQLWHVVSNQVGSVGHTTDYGHSRIIDPNGNVIADTGSAEGMVIAETDLLIDAPVLDVDVITPVNPSQSTAATWGKIKGKD